jgi:uncharacterized membrane protein YdjX (TVP38/TMEM64 family)
MSARTPPFRRLVALSWAAVVVAVLLGWTLSPERFGPSALRAFLAEHPASAFSIYAGASLVRGFFLLPSTPFVLTGALLFPHHPVAVWIISMIGVWVASVLAYAFPEWLGLDTQLEGKHAALYARLHAYMERYGLWTVALWAMAPFTPTDLVCAAAGLVRMRFSKFFLGITLGEIPLVTAYVLTGQVG